VTFHGKICGLEPRNLRPQALNKPADPYGKSKNHAFLYRPSSGRTVNPRSAPHLPLQELLIAALLLWRLPVGRRGG
jgi:hypothetical protein